MARTVEAIIAQQIGDQILTIARLQSELDIAQEIIAKLEAEKAAQIPKD